MDEINGIVYYEMESPYSGDTTKNCGLTAAEVDGNFFFLRGKNVSAVTFNSEDKEIEITMLDGEVVSTFGLGSFIDTLILSAMTVYDNRLNRLECELSGLTDSTNIQFDETTSALTDVDVRLDIIEAGGGPPSQHVGANTVGSVQIIDNSILDQDLNTEVRGRMLGNLTDDDMEEWFED